MQVYSITRKLPLPDDAIDLTANGTVVAYQGYAGKNVLETLGYNNGGLDPKDDNYFTYSVTPNRKSFQLMSFMEEIDSLQTHMNIP